MAIFSILKSQPIIQVDDKIRLSGLETFVSKDEAAITLVEIEPEAAAGFIDVTGVDVEASDWYLDWSYAGISRTVTATLRVTTDGAPVTSTLSVEVITAVDDKLFSTDADLVRYENEILDFLPDGYSSFNYVHRKSRDLIIDWFNEQGYRNTDHTKITPTEVLDTDEVRRWAESWALQIIYQDNSNSIDDKYDEKSRFYESKAVDARRRCIISLDLNKDGEIDIGENIQIQSVRLFRI